MSSRPPIAAVVHDAGMIPGVWDSFNDIYRRIRLLRGEASSLGVAREVAEATAAGLLVRRVTAGVPEWRVPPPSEEPVTP